MQGKEEVTEEVQSSRRQKIRMGSRVLMGIGLR